MIEGYSPWSELGENRRYCLIDTTDIVEVYRWVISNFTFTV